MTLSQGVLQTLHIIISIFGRWILNWWTPFPPTSYQKPDIYFSFIYLLLPYSPNKRNESLLREDKSDSASLEHEVGGVRYTCKHLSKVLDFEGKIWTVFKKNSWFLWTLPLSWVRDSDAFIGRCRFCCCWQSSPANCRVRIRTLGPRHWCWCGERSPRQLWTVDLRLWFHTTESLK